MTWLLTLIKHIVPFLTATERLLAAAKQSLRPPRVPGTMPEPPPPIGKSGARQAEAYLRGGIDQAELQRERARMRAVADDLSRRLREREAVESEQPVDDGEGKP